MIRKRDRINKYGKTVRTYQAIVKSKNYPDQVKTFPTLREASAWERKIKSSIDAGTFHDDKDLKDKTLVEAINRYLEDPFFRKKKNWKTITGHLRYWKEVLGKYAFSQLTPDIIAKRRDELSSGITVRHKIRSPSSVNRYLASLSSVFKIAIEEWRWLNESPMKYVRKLKEPRGRKRYLSDKERFKLLDACKESKSPYLYTIVVIALSTGMRRGEILNLKWNDVDLETGRMTLLETKNGEIRVVYVTGHALEILRIHAQEMMFKSDYLFPNKWGVKPVDITSSWQYAVGCAELEDFRFHDLRHSAASYLAMNGASPSEIAEILGHKTLEMVKRYAHLSENHTKTVLEDMNTKIFG